MDSKYYVFAIQAMGDITVTIAAPAVIAALAGRALDVHFHTGKLFFVILLVLAFLITITVLLRKIRFYGQAYQQLIK